jgi:hypothetical protein
MESGPYRKIAHAPFMDIHKVSIRPCVIQYFRFVWTRTIDASCKSALLEKSAANPSFYAVRSGYSQPKPR